MHWDKLHLATCIGTSILPFTSTESEVNNMAKDVVCEVNSCTHWAEDNKCSAESIFVAFNSHKEASRPEETDCRTFESK